MGTALGRFFGDVVNFASVLRICVPALASCDQMGAESMACGVLNILSGYSFKTIWLP